MHKIVLKEGVGLRARRGQKHDQQYHVVSSNSSREGAHLQCSPFMEDEASSQPPPWAAIQTLSTSWHFQRWADMKHRRCPGECLWTFNQHKQAKRANTPTTPLPFFMNSTLIHKGRRGRAKATRDYHSPHNQPWSPNLIRATSSS